MEEQTADQTVSPGEPGTPEPVLSEKDTAESAASKDEAAAQGQVPSPARKQPEPVKELRGIEELLRTEDGTFSSVQFQYSVRPIAENTFQQMVAQGQYARDPWKQIPFPTRRQDFGATGDLFAKIKLAIAEQTQLSDENSGVLAFWILSTWCQDILPIAPGLAITGSAHEGDAVLRILRAFSYHPVLVAGITSATLNDIYWERKPTLLISDPNLSKRMAALLGSSTCRGYLAFRKAAGCPTSPFDYFCSKAIFLGEDRQMVSVLQHYLHINASPAPSIESRLASPLSEEMTQSIQNQLLGYRIKNLPGAHTSHFSAAGLSPEVTTIANALGRCIVQAPELQAELVSLLAPHSKQQITDRLDDLGTLCVGAALRLSQQGKTEISVGEIAAEVNRVLRDRGEELQYSAEKVGHRLKKVGLLSRRLGSRGNGFVMDRATQVLLHEAASVFGCVGLTDDKENLHYQFCEQKK